MMSSTEGAPSTTSSVEGTPSSSSSRDGLSTSCSLGGAGTSGGSGPSAGSLIATDYPLIDSGLPRQHDHPRFSLARPAAALSRSHRASRKRTSERALSP